MDLTGEEGVSDHNQAEALALSSPLLLPYERQLVEEAIQDDCVVITATGLGWQRVAAVLLRIAQHARMAEAQGHERNPPQGQQREPGAASADASPPQSAPPGATRGSGPGPGGGCVLVLGASPWQRALIAAELARHDPALPPPLDITNEVPALERIQLYRALPGCRPLFITPRILVVDLLARRLRGREVAGLLLLNAHRATDTSGEGFAVALLRADCPTGSPEACWVRALSDAPTAFNHGFNKVEKVMKALHLRRLHLWPRFQEHVRQCLDEHKPVVVEWDQELSAPMVLIQAALLEVLEGLIRELRRTNNKLDASELVLENGVLRSFDEIVRRQLDPIWHTVSWKTRRICTDLRTLRELSALLLSADSVTFLAHLEGLRQSEGVRCVWLFHDATHAIFEQARRRVYIFRQPGGAAAAAAGGSEVEAVLEEPPKWGLLVEVLGEVQRQRRQLRALDAGAAAAQEAMAESTDGEGDGQPQQQQQRAAGEVRTGLGTGGGTGSGGASARDPAGRDPAGRDPAAAPPTSAPSPEVEVVDLASSGSGSDCEEDDDRGVAAAAAPQPRPATAAAAAARSRVAAATGNPAARAPPATDGATAGPSGAATPTAAASLRTLLEDLGLGSGDPGEGTGGGGPPAVSARDLQLLAEAGRGPVLVVARELHSARLLERVVREGGRAVMLHLYEAYLLSKLQPPEGARGGRGSASGGGADGGGGGRGGGRGGRGGRGGGWKRYRGGGDPDEAGRGPVLRPGEHQALLAEAQRVGAERGIIPAPRGRVAKRAKHTHDATAGACAGVAAGSAAPPAAAAGRGGGRGGGGRSRGRGAAGGRSRQRKPDDSPVRVAAAAAYGEGDDPSAEEEEQQAAGGGGDTVSDGEDDGGDGAADVGPARRRLAAAQKQGRGGRAARGGRGASGSRGRRRQHRGGDGGSDAVAAEEATDGSADDGVDTGGAYGSAKDHTAHGSRPTAAAPSASGRTQGGSAAAPRRGRGATAAAAAAAGAGAEGAAASGRTAAPTTAAAAIRDDSGGSAPVLLPPLLRDVHFVSLDSHDEFVLWRLRPSFVIMYEPDLAFLRQVELYQAERCLAGGCPLWLHTLSYAQSLEQQRFRAAVERERDTMLRLIQAKQHLVLPAPTAAPAGGNRGPNSGGGGAGALSADLWLDVYSANALTRAAGGRAAARGGGSAAAPKRLVVDVREFMSSLPAVLHQKGFELLPVTLEVGDYVLSPQLVVERKSLPDLHASLASGRLYHQAEVMCRHYARPLLLIEFDADRQFGLQSASELGDDIDPKNVISKLTLLTIHFPKLRLLWSRSPHATADLFAALKSNQEEPDPAAAALVGVPLGPDGVPIPLGQQQQQPGGGAAAALEAVVNQPALELLRRLPGVNDSNYRAILGHVSSLAELASLPLERLETIMASAKNAKALRDFLDAPCPRI